MKSIVVLLFLIFIANSSTLAQTGCIGNGIPFQTNGTMYTTYSGGYYELYGGKILNPYSQYCVRPTNRGCTIKGLGLYPGTEVTFGPLPCPIDSYIYPLIMSVGLYGVLRFRNIQKRS